MHTTNELEQPVLAAAHSTRQPADKRIVLSIFSNERDNVPSQREMSWHECRRAYFRTSNVRSQKGGLAFSPVSYRAGTRRGASNVDHIYCAVFDVEHHGSFDQIKPRLDGYEYLCHSSYSHTIGHPRYRIVLPLEEPVPARAWPDAWSKLNQWLGGINDPSTKDASRIYYLPSQPPGVQGHFLVHGEGRLLNAAELPTLAQDHGRPTAHPRVPGLSIGRMEQLAPDPLSPPEGLDRVVKRCKFMSHMSKPDVQRAASRGLWRAMISNASRFEEADEWIHAASCEHPDYDSFKTDVEIRSCQSFVGGPITCQRIREEGFDGCPPHGCKTVAGNITKSPAGLWMGNEAGCDPLQEAIFGEELPPAYADLPLPSWVAKFLVAKYPGGLAYINEDFLAYGDGRWRVIEERGEFRNSVARYLGKNVAEAKQINELTAICKDFLAKPSASSEPHRSLICLENGTLDTSICELREHSPDYWLRCKIPARWEYSASCSRWIQFLEQVFALDPDKDEKVSFLQEWFGYCLTPDASQHKFVWMVGSGGNGKSVLLSVLTHLLGSQNVSHAHLERLEKPQVRAELENKLVNISSEMSSEATVADGYLKAIVSGDVIDAEKKFKPPYSFAPFVRIVGATNHLPQLRDLSDGFFRRAIVLTFNRRFSEAEQDKTLEQKLRAELDGILTWSISGLQRLRARGTFLIPKSSVAALDTYRQESDPVGMFVEECVRRSESEGLRASAIYKAYSEWCKAYGYVPKGNVRFGKRLAELGFEQFRIAEGKCWRVREKEGNGFLNHFQLEDVLRSPTNTADSM